MALLQLAKTVLFYNMLPNQKADAARLIKERFKQNPVVCAVGDGCNDISMIQEADVGIGVFD